MGMHAHACQHACQLFRSCRRDLRRVYMFLRCRIVVTVGLCTRSGTCCFGGTFIRSCAMRGQLSLSNISVQYSVKLAFECSFEHGFPLQVHSVPHPPTPQPVNVNGVVYAIGCRGGFMLCHAKQARFAKPLTAIMAYHVETVAVL